MAGTNEIMEQLFADAEEKSAFPFWPIVEQVRPNEPQPKAVPFVWTLADMRALLERARGLVIGEGAAERRVFILANPAMDPRHTTDGILAAIQLILPGEIAASHRHTASAIRFVIEGEGAYTQVGGARIRMSPGDLVLTPSRKYHDHGNDGTDAVIWLDALDLPLFHMLPANFSNQYKAEQYPAVDADDSPLVFRWADMVARLHSVPDPTITFEYHNPDNGGPILRNMRATATRIDAGHSTQARRETASGVYQVVGGAGRTRAGSTTLRWQKGDTFAVPAWTEYEHVNDGSGTCYLFRIDEQPALQKLGMYVTGHDVLADAE